MKITSTRTDASGTSTFLIEANEVSFSVLLHCIRRIPGASVIKSRQWWLTDDAHASIKYKDTLITIDAVFSDLSVECGSSGETFDEFISILRGYHLTRWDRLFGVARLWAWIALVGLLALFLYALLK